MKNKNKKNRLFVGIDLPQKVLDEMQRIQNVLQQEQLFEGRFIPPEQVHITLKFIGEVPENEVENIDDALKSVMMPSLQARFGKIDVFDSDNAIHIIYAHIICPELIHLATSIETVLFPWVEKEKRPFVSHATLARVKKVQDNKALMHFLNQLVVEPIVFDIVSFQLKRSELSQEGAVYTTISNYFLQ